MKLITLLEDSKPENRLVIIYGGRFQPFHKGHFKAYKWLCKKFSEKNVWIATSNKTNFNPKSGAISPFDFKEKKEMMVSLYGIMPRKIMQTANPTFAPKEIFKLYKGFAPVYVAAVGEKDEERYKKGNFFKPMPEEFDTEELFSVKDKAGYYIVVPTFQEISGTEVRDELKAAQGSSREALFKRFFGKYDDTIDSLITARLKDVK